MMIHGIHGIWSLGRGDEIWRFPDGDCDGIHHLAYNHKQLKQWCMTLYNSYSEWGLSQPKESRN
jgi:hypothetical protein